MRKVLLRTACLLVISFFLIAPYSGNAKNYFPAPRKTIPKSPINILPTIIAPANLSVSTDPYSNVATAVFLGTPVTTGNPVSVVNNAPASYPVGITPVLWTVTDDIGNTATATQTVTVKDTEKPVIGRLGEISVVNDAGKCGALVNLIIPYTFDNTGIVYLTNDAPSYFNVGSVRVTWTATDQFGNSDTMVQKITVIDNELPIVSIPTAILVTNDAGKCGAVITLSNPIASDNCGIASITNNAPVLFPAGTTIVTWTVKDLQGYVVTAIQNVTVTDIEKPKITAPANKTVTVSGSNSATNVILGTPVTSDNCGIKSILNNAPTSYPIGITTVTWTVKDNSDNVSTAAQTVTVRKRKSNSIGSDYASMTMENETNNDLEISITPNPSTNYFTLRLQSRYATPVSLRVTDASGRVVDARSNLAANSSIQIGHNYNTGTYFAEMIQGANRKVVQLIKIK